MKIYCFFAMVLVFIRCFVTERWLSEKKIKVMNQFSYLSIVFGKMAFWLLVCFLLAGKELLKKLPSMMLHRFNSVFSVFELFIFHHFHGKYLTI